MPNLVAEQIDALAAFAPTALPVISLYLNTQSDDHGRDHFASYIKKEFHTRAKTLAPQSAARASFVRDVDRIEKYLANELRPSTNGLALFACAGMDNFFEALQLNALLERHEIYVDHRPHLYTLALVNKQFPRYAAVVADTDSARLFVFGLSATISEDLVQSTKLSRTQTGGGRKRAISGICRTITSTMRKKCWKFSIAWFARRRLSTSSSRAIKW